MLNNITDDFRPSSLKNDEVFHKVGNVLAFLAAHIPDLYITKLSKLIYILDEFSVKEIGMPVTGLEYKVAKMGPLATDVWSSLRYHGGHFNSFVKTFRGDTAIRIIPNPDFSFNENIFTEYELDLLNTIVSRFGSMRPEKLVEYTHAEGSPWEYSKNKHNITFASDDPNVTDFVIDFTPLLDTEIKKKNFTSFFQSLSF